MFSDACTDCQPEFCHNQRWHKICGGGCLIILYAGKTLRCVRLEAAQRRMITEWHQITARAIWKPKDPSALLSLSWYFDVTQRKFCTALLQVEHTYRRSAQHLANVREEGWAHSDLGGPRGERRRMLERKTIFIQTSRRKLRIRVNW